MENSKTKKKGLTRVYLMGSLGKAMGRTVWDLDVKSVPEALRAIDINTREKFSKYLSLPNKYYKIAIQKKTNLLDKEEVRQLRTGNSTIYVMPTIKGSSSGGGKIIAGIALIIVAIYAPYLIPVIGKVGAGYVATAAIGFGASLILGGVTQLLTPTAKQTTSLEVDQKESTTFRGNAVSVVQGGCVPLVYGRALVSPIPVAITLNVDDLTVTAPEDPDTVTETDLNGGAIQYN